MQLHLPSPPPLSIFTPVTHVHLRYVTTTGLPHPSLPNYTFFHTSSYTCLPTSCPATPTPALDPLCSSWATYAHIPLPTYSPPLTPHVFTPFSLSFTPTHALPRLPPHPHPLSRRADRRLIYAPGIFSLGNRRKRRETVAISALFSPVHFEKIKFLGDFHTLSLRKSYPRKRALFMQSCNRSMGRNMNIYLLD